MQEDAAGLEVYQPMGLQEEADEPPSPPEALGSPVRNGWIQQQKLSQDMAGNSNDPDEPVSNMFPSLLVSLRSLGCHYSAPFPIPTPEVVTNNYDGS